MARNRSHSQFIYGHQSELDCRRNRTQSSTDEFHTFNNHAMSLMTLLYKQNQIPSLTYNYNAGAKCRLNSVLGSLPLSGYDDSLFDMNNNLATTSFFDQTRDLTVGLQFITSDGSLNSKGNTSLLPIPELYLIDTTVSQSYLAKDACAAFEKAFGLELNEDYGLYLLNASQYTKLSKLNPNIIFTLGAFATGGGTIDITFPYAAFDLNVSYPYNESYYFPIVPAANSTQNTLGRQFLQEACITVDYNRGNFSVFPIKWSLDDQKHIVSITPPANSTETSSPGTTSTAASPTKKSSGIGTGAIVGIVIGVLAIATLAASWFFWRRHKKHQADVKAAAAVAAVIAAEEENKPLPLDPYADTTNPGIRNWIVRKLNRRSCTQNIISWARRWIAIKLRVRQRWRLVTLYRYRRWRGIGCFMSWRRRMGCMSCRFNGELRGRGEGARIVLLVRPLGRIEVLFGILVMLSDVSSK